MKGYKPAPKEMEQFFEWLHTQIDDCNNRLQFAECALEIEARRQAIKDLLSHCKKFDYDEHPDSDTFPGVAVLQWLWEALHDWDSRLISASNRLRSQRSEFA